MTEALISKLGRWQELPPETQDRIRNLAGNRLTLVRGDHPLMRIDQTSCSLLMLDGWAANYKDAPSGKRIITEILVPGDLRQASAQRDRSVGTVMLSAGSALLVEASEIAALMQDPVVRAAVEWTERVREAILTEWLVNISSRRAYPRLAHLLCELSARMNSAGLLEDNICQMPLTQVDLANALGMTNVHLNMAFGRLRSEKVIDLVDRRLIILNQKRLEAIAGFDDGYLLRWPTALPERRSAIGRRAEERRHSVHN